MKNPLAEVTSPDSLELIKAESPETENAGLTYFCPDPQCLDPERTLLLKRSTRGNKYFSHRAGFDHDIHPKTLLHKMALAEFKAMKKYRLPDGLNGKQWLEIDWAKSMVEFNGIHGDKPDVHLVDKDGFECLIEVTISYSVNDKKFETAKAMDLPLIELNLQRFFIENDENARNNIDSLQYHAPELVGDTSNAQWVFIPERLKSRKNVFSNPAVIGGAVLLGAAGVAAYFSFRHR